jgi:hemoglobin
MSASLYERLGGASGIRAMAEDAIAAHLQNPLISPRFAVADLDHATKMGSEFFAAGSGGPDPYTGKDMRSAHRGMNISEQEFLAVVDDIMGVADKKDLDDVTKQEVLAILYSLKGEIVRG